MKVAVTGASGFIGHHVINNLLNRNVDIMMIGRNKPNSFSASLSFIEHDILSSPTEDLFVKFGRPDKLVHLAWSHLDNFKNEQHIRKVLPAHEAFLDNLLSNGLQDLTVTGTCLEYGLIEGELREEMAARPIIPYAIAKKALFDFLQSLLTKHQYSLKWMRLFYMYGAGQSPKSILSQLQKAIDEEAPSFKMSEGEQWRDYLPVKDVAENIVIFALQNNVTGVVNCCSGRPVSIKNLVQNYLESVNKSIHLETGFYPYTDYEPFRFWGNTDKLNQLRQTSGPN